MADVDCGEDVWHGRKAERLHRLQVASSSARVSGVRCIYSSRGEGDEERMEMKKHNNQIRRTKGHAKMIRTQFQLISAVQ